MKFLLCLQIHIRPGIFLKLFHFEGQEETGLCLKFLQLVSLSLPPASSEIKQWLLLISASVAS